MGEPPTQRMSYVDYLAMEQQAGERHQFIDGRAYAMAGGSLRHSALKVALGSQLYSALRGSPCSVYDSDARLYIPLTHDATYPDFSVVCEDAERPDADRHAFTNPTLIAEVLSPSTEKWDRGGKFALYRTLPSLRHYLLISSETCMVELFSRNDDDTWTLSVHTPGDTLTIDTPGLTLSVDALYDGIPEEPPAEDATL